MDVSPKAEFPCLKTQACDPFDKQNADALIHDLLVTEKKVMLVISDLFILSDEAISLLLEKTSLLSRDRTYNQSQHFHHTPAAARHMQQHTETED